MAKNTIKPYIGKIVITCTKKKGCLRNLRENVQPGCMDCPAAASVIVDLEDKPLFKYISPAEKTGKRIKKSKKNK